METRASEMYKMPDKEVLPISVSSSRAGRRQRLKTLALPEDPTPRIPWRVLSLPAPVLARGGQEAAAAKEDPPFTKSEFDNGSTTRVGGENTAVCLLRSSHGATTAMSVDGRSFVDGETSSRSSKPSKGSLIGLGRIWEESSCDSSIAARRRTESVRAASWERVASVRTRSPQVEMPSIRVSDTDAAGSPSLVAALPAVDVAPPIDSRAWSATPPNRAHRVASCRLHPQVEVNPGGSPKAFASDVREARKVPRVPKAPPRPMCTWEVLRQRTLKATLGDPSIFRRNIQSKLEGEDDDLPETTPPSRRFVLSRRILEFVK